MEEVRTEARLVGYNMPGNKRNAACETVRTFMHSQERTKTMTRTMLKKANEKNDVVRSEHATNVRGKGESKHERKQGERRHVPSSSSHLSTGLCAPAHPTAVQTCLLGKWHYRWRSMNRKKNNKPEMPMPDNGKRHIHVLAEHVYTPRTVLS